MEDSSAVAVRRRRGRHGRRSRSRSVQIRDGKHGQSICACSFDIFLFVQVDWIKLMWSVFRVGSLGRGDGASGVLSGSFPGTS